MLKSKNELIIKGLGLSQQVPLSGHKGDACCTDSVNNETLILNDPITLESDVHLYLRTSTTETVLLAVSNTSTELNG